MTVLMLLACALTGAAEDVLPTLGELIEEEGLLAFTDGSSSYQFYADGSFFMEPVSLCGRAVEGTWEWLDESRVEIDGIWSWYNGISAIDDRRRMIVYMYLRSDVTEPAELIWRTPDAVFHDVYFTVEELSPPG